MRVSEEEFADILKRTGVRGAAADAVVTAPPFKLPGNEAGAFALGEMPKREMNKTEAAYAAQLEVRKSLGEILWWRREPMRLRLADDSYYKPDFGVLPANRVFELHETKGFWREAARVRIKVAAELFPFKFIAITRAKDGWEREEFS
jgi:hypothetical protein